MGLSVDLEKLTAHKITVIDPNLFGLLRISAPDVRSVPGLDCIHHPVPGNDAHSLITGKITKGNRNQLIDLSETILQVELR